MRRLASLLPPGKQSRLLQDGFWSARVDLQIVCHNDAMMILVTAGRLSDSKEFEACASDCLASRSGSGGGAPAHWAASVAELEAEGVPAVLAAHASGELQRRHRFLLAAAPHLRVVCRSRQCCMFKSCPFSVGLQRFISRCPFSCILPAVTMLTDDRQPRHASRTDRHARAYVLTRHQCLGCLATAPCTPCHSTDACPAVLPQSDVALLLADYKELVLRYEALSRAVACRPAPSPPRPTPVPAPATSSSVYSINLPAPAQLHQPQPQTRVDSTVVDTSVREDAAPQPTEDSQFIQRSDESAVQDLLGSSLEPSSLHGSGAAPQHRAAAAAFDPFGDVADLAHSGIEDGGTTAPMQAALADPFLALERAASAMGPPSSGAQAERDAESELAAFRAELPAAEPDDAQQPSTAAPEAEELHLGSAAATAAAHQPDSTGADVFDAASPSDVSSVPEAEVPDPAANDAAQSHPTDIAGTEAMPGSAATEDPAAWAASWGNGSEDAAVQPPTAAAADSVERSVDAGDPAPPVDATSSPDDPAKELPREDDIGDPVQDEPAESPASAAVHQPDISADESQKPQEADDAAQPADAADDAERRPSVPNGLHAVDAYAVRTELGRDDTAPGSGLFAGLDVETKPGDKESAEESDVAQSESAPHLTDAEAQEGGF